MPEDGRRKTLKIKVRISRQQKVAHKIHAHNDFRYGMSIRECNSLHFQMDIPAFTRAKKSQCYVLVRQTLRRSAYIISYWALRAPRFPTIKIRVNS